MVERAGGKQRGERAGGVPARGAPPRPEPVGLLAFVYGVAGRSELPGPVLVALMADCGVGPGATRSLLARLRRRGDLTVTREGRITRYALAGTVRAAWERGRGGGEGAPAPWDGTLHGILYTVPERQRAFRDSVRRITHLAGYGLLRAGLVVSPRDRWELVRDQAGPPPAGARLTPLELRMAPGDAAAAVAEAWDLDAVATAYRRLTARLEAVADAPVAADGASLRRFREAAFPAYSAFARHPDLPAELLPPDWPAASLAAALRRVRERYDAPLRSYVNGLVDDGVGASRAGAAGSGDGPAGR